MQRIRLRDRTWRVESATKVAEDKTLFRLFDPNSAERLEALCPPEIYESLPEEAPVFTKSAIAPLEAWQSSNLALKLSCVEADEFAAFYGGSDFSRALSIRARRQTAPTPAPQSPCR